MARFCTSCGATLADEKKFCTECGVPADVMAAPPALRKAAPAPPPVHPAYSAPAVAVASSPPAPLSSAALGGDAPPPKGSKYEPITTGGYIGITLLMLIPVVGLILVIVWACGGCRKVNKRAFARASLIMMLVGLILSLIIGFAGQGMVKAALKEAGISTEQFGGSGGAVSGLSGLADSGRRADSGRTADSGKNESLDELGELGALLKGLQGLAGEDSDRNGIGDLIDNAEDINRAAEAVNDGWPQSLHPYPGGTASAVASYRTEISGTTLEEMLGWIESLKADGFVYQDFYDFGMSEQDMLSINGWWGYDGKTYLSVSYLDGVATVDHTKELPDLESYFN